MAYRKSKVTGERDYGHSFLTGKAINDLTYERAHETKDTYKELKIDNFKKGYTQPNESKFSIYLTFGERTKAHFKARTDYVRFAQTYKDIKASKGTTSMMLQAFRQLEFINIATAKYSEEFKRETNAIFNEITYREDEPRRLSPLRYIDMEGNDRQINLGINKDRYGRKLYYEERLVKVPIKDSSGRNVKDNNGNILTEEKIKWVDITEREFYDNIGLAYRSNVKAERGMQRSLFELSDRDGNKLIITDARDDNEKENSYQDHSAPLNFYQRDASGSTQQLSGKELATVIETSGVTNIEIGMKKFGGVLARVSGKVGDALGREVLHIAGRQINDNLRQPIEFR